MASNTMYVDLHGAAQSKKNSKTVRYIIGGFAAGVMLAAAINMLNKSNSVAPEMAVGASGPIELSVGTSPFMSMIRAPRVKSPAASVVVRGGAYLPPQAKPFADNYLGKWKGQASQYSSPSYSPAPAPASFSQAPTQAAGKGLTADEIEFMERQARRAAMPAPAPREYKDTHGRTRILER
eukprot:gnl/TRDRNA2_/TRDRNA2_177231_c0_seq1.p1 gnl/TRDRNA2_/TRDRNA2_177231_c0~~gnl/TRDRNA2_/TRDRNA2_177231_c0_seq1.p1  ORF type:complete len:180 (+),score=19.87 gnl/TRDRNA2_/TRDRNA2_177231_c0_seq1:71-610(+)